MTLSTRRIRKLIRLAKMQVLLETAQAALDECRTSAETHSVLDQKLRYQLDDVDPVLDDLATAIDTALSGIRLSEEVRGSQWPPNLPPPTPDTDALRHRGV